MNPRATLLSLSTLGVLVACGGGESGAHQGPWELKVDSAPAAGARPTAWLRTVGKEGPPGKPQTEAVILSFDCRPDHNGATIMTEQALRQGSVEIGLSLDGGQARQLDGFAGTTPTGGQVVLTAPLDSVLDLVGGHRQATIEYADGAGSSKTTALFPVAGLETYRERFLAACTPRDTPGS